MKNPNHDELEQFIHRTLRSLPDRRAPGTLEARVLAAVERQALVPWWHKGWAYWPAAVRATFLAGATGVAGAVLMAAYTLFAGVDTSAVAAEAAAPLAAFQRIVDIGGWLAGLAKSVVAGIPALWLYGGLAFVAAMYASVFGLGAVAYRALYRTN
jgi:hypothetical protein